MLTAWLSEQRKKFGISMNELALKTGLTQATLSRIESQKMQLTLFSAVRMMSGLGLSWLDLFQQGFIRENLPVPELYRQTYQLDSEFPCLLFHDIDRLESSGVLRRGVASAIVSRLLERFIRKYAPHIPDDKVELLAVNCYSFLNSPGIEDRIARQYFPEVDFRYPQDFPPETLRKIYLSAGVFILPDLGRYAKYLREMRTLSLRKIASQVELTHVALRNIENIPSHKIKLDDLINLDNALELNGELVIFAWRTAELYLGLHQGKTEGTGRITPWNEPEIHFIEKLVIASRLFQRYFPDDREWLDWYRQESLNGFENVVR